MAVINNQSTGPQPDAKDSLQDSGIKLPTTSYQKQYARENAEPLSPFQAVDSDIVMHAQILEDNAAKQANRDRLPATDDVER